MKDRIAPENRNAFVKLGLAWAVGTLASLTCFPIDTLKRRIMLDGSPGFTTTGGSTSGLMGAVAYAKGMFASGGIQMFYRGCLINALKSAPATALTFVCNDVLKELINIR